MASKSSSNQQRTRTKMAEEKRAEAQVAASHDRERGQRLYGALGTRALGSLCAHLGLPVSPQRPGRLRILAQQDEDKVKEAIEALQLGAEKTKPKGGTGKRRVLTPEVRNMFIHILVDENPKRPGSKSAARFNLYREGMTVQAALDAGVYTADILYDSGRTKHEKAFIELTEAKVRKKARASRRRKKG